MHTEDIGMKTLALHIARTGGASPLDYPAHWTMGLLRGFAVITGAVAVIGAALTLATAFL